MENRGVMTTATLEPELRDDDFVGPESPAEPPQPARLWSTVGLAVSFYLPLAIYLILGLVLALHFHSFINDAGSREANGFYILFSRDPHVAAVGFVWNPLTSLVELPLVALKVVFPGLTRDILAAVITMAILMAGAAYQVMRFLKEMAVAPVARWAIWAAFAFNPMVLYYGSNGMSEALFTYCLVGSTRYLVRWTYDRSLRSLVPSAVFLGFAYLARNEAVAPIAAATLVVFALTYYSDQGMPPRWRRRAACTEAVIFALPGVAAFVGWALVSWVIVGHPFEQYASAYGTASQLRLSGKGAGGAAGLGLVAHFKYVVKAMWFLAPLLPVMIVYAGRRAWVNRDPAVAAIVGVLGAVCAFELAAYTTGQIAWALRYVIYAIPFATMLCGFIASSRGASTPPRSTSSSRFSLAVVLGVLLVVPGPFSTLYADFFNPVGSGDQAFLGWVLWPGSQLAQSDHYRTEWGDIQAADHLLDGLHLPDGSVLVDNAEPCVPQLILSSSRPRQFVIPNDIDFEKHLGAPYHYGVRYLLVAPTGGIGSVDALNVEYPSLYQSGAGIATLSHDGLLRSCGDFRLYRVLPSGN